MPLMLLGFFSHRLFNMDYRNTVENHIKKTTFKLMNFLTINFKTRKKNAVIVHIEYM